MIDITHSGFLPKDAFEKAQKKLAQTRAKVPHENGTEKMARLTQETQEVTTLYNMGVAVGSTLNLREVIWILFKESGRLIDTRNCAIALYDSESDTLYFALTFVDGKKDRSFSVKLAESAGLTRRIIETQTPMLLPDLQETNDTVEVARLIPKDKPIHSWLGVPIFNPVLTEENVQGAIVLWNHEPNQFSDHELWLLSAICTQASIAIRNAKLYEASQRRAMEMAVLNDVAQTLSSTLHLDEVLTRIMDQVEGMLNVEAGSLLLTDPATGELVFQIALGDKADEVKPFRIPEGEGIAGQVALTGKPLIVENVDKDDRHFKELDEKTKFITYNILCVPLVLYDKVIGVLEVMNKKDGHFTKDDMRLLTSVASYAAIAIDNARLHESVLAERDRVIEAEEQARRQLARDLHDGPTQIVASIQMSIDFSKKALQKDPSLLPNEFDHMYSLAERATHQMRTMLFELRPLVLETQGLVSALQVFMERRQKDMGPKPRLVLNTKTYNPNGDLSRFDDKIETTIFSLVQETVNNAIKHAKADQITVTLKETPDAVYTIIEDDGVGFDVEAVMNNYEERGSLGMINIRERSEVVGGEVNMWSKLGEGTRFTIYIPKEKNARQKKRGLTGQLTLPSNMLPE